MPTRSGWPEWSGGIALTDDILSSKAPLFVQAPGRSGLAPMAAASFTGHAQPGMPPRAPCLMPVRARGWQGPGGRPDAARHDGAALGQRVIAAVLTLGMFGGLLWVMAAALGALWAARPALALAIAALFAINTLWIAWAAATALIGVVNARRAAYPAAAATVGTSAGRVAILVTLCGEAPMPVVAAARWLHDDLARAGLGARCDIFLLSDTAGPAAVAREAEAVAALAGLPGVYYRRRAERTGRKPGNIADWVRGWGGGYAFMAVLDADSRMTAARLGALIAQMDGDASLGLLQAGMRLVPATSRFGALQRLSARLCGPVFVAGLAGWAGREGNFWGHNALIRVAAFAGAAGLPRLPGRAPFGGDILSHDFIEAAWLRRTGWGVAIAPETRGSFEDGPQSLGAFHRRDRRWCQGNLQHLTLAFGARMHGMSRLHLLSGIHSYLAAPVWLMLVALIAIAQPGVATFVPLVAVMALLMVPKLAGVVHWATRGRRLWRRPGVLLRALAVELGLSTLLAPIVLVRQTASVLAVMAGRDCGWTPAAAQPRLGAALRKLPDGMPEAAAGAAFVGIALAAGADLVQVAWLAPLVVPLLAAPVVVRWLDAPWRSSHAATKRAAPALAGSLRARATRRAA